MRAEEIWRFFALLYLSISHFYGTQFPAEELFILCSDRAMKGKTAFYRYGELDQASAKNVKKAGQ